MPSFLRKKKQVEMLEKGMISGHRADYSAKYYFAFDGLIYARVSSRTKYRRAVKSLCVDTLKK